MSVALIIGSGVGALIGARHAWGLLRRTSGRSTPGDPRHATRSRATAAYYGLWALVLWTVFGSYLLYLWLFAVVLYGCRGAVRRLATLGSA
ncbi:MAG: hypothetical protein R3195_08930 [Gemmatimonadota bacterium]|nr:hypothetical protein [Gemmatimonadota bacterium]